MKKFLSILLCLLFCVSLLAGVMHTADATTYSGQCGDNLYWTFNSATGVLKVTGTGEMWYYDGASGDCLESAWDDYKKQITTVDLSEGVTFIQDTAFSNCPKLSIVILPYTVKNIGWYAFDGCSNLTDVYYSGTSSQKAKISIRTENEPLLNANWIYVTKPVIVTRPKGVSVKTGKTASFAVAAAGKSLTYQWQYSKNNGSTWTNWSGKTSATLSFKGSTTNNGYLYRCVVKNSSGSVTSMSARLTVTDVKPKILTQPAAQTVTSGSTATFKVAVGGSGLTYQWQYSKNNGSTWTNWSGKTSATLSFKGGEINNGYLYRCVVKNSYGSVTSSSARLTVSNVKPKILTHPADQSAVSGTSITMKVVAGGSGLSYQWQYSKNNGSTWTNWSGKTSSSFSVMASDKNNGCMYRCKVTNSYGTVYSNAATLKLK